MHPPEVAIAVVVSIAVVGIIPPQDKGRWEGAAAVT